MVSRSPLSRNKYLTAFFINSSRIFLISIPDALSSKVLRNGERVFPYQGRKRIQCAPCQMTDFSAMVLYNVVYFSESEIPNVMLNKIQH